MKKHFALVFGLFSAFVFAQEAVNPAIKSFGIVSTVPDATVIPDPTMEYKIVVDVMSGGEDHSEVFFSMNNVARMINLHAMAGVPKENLDVVVAIHNVAIWASLNDEAHQKRFGVMNPHTPLIKELVDYGVKVVVCGQSLIKREIPKEMLIPGIEVATSALTTLTTYQLQGYALMRF